MTDEPYHPADDEQGKTRPDSLRLRGFDYSSCCIYFITIVVEHRRNLFNDPRLAQAILHVLLEQRERLRFNLYCYCLMPDHFHGLIGCGASGLTLGRICGAFKSVSTRQYWQWHQGRLWQRRFHDHIIRGEEEFYETRAYIMMNPVRKGLVTTPEEWPYSGCPDNLS